MEILRAENITKKYANHLALDSVSMSVNKGTVFGLLGPNGAGKTTFLRIINQIIAPDSGKITYNGASLSMHNTGDFGYLPEERGLYKKMKIGEQSLYLAQLKGLSKNDAIAKLKYWFEKFQITSWWDKKAEELSKGMQQKVQFIITVLHEPKLLIFDEPFSGFDPINTNLVRQEILDLKEKGTTIILSTHNMSSVEELCDDILLINKSKNILSGSINEIRKNYKSNTYEIYFSGDVNVLEATLRYQYEILNHTKLNDKQLLTIKILDEKLTTNQLISSLIPFGNIISFNEKIPGMSDIFIQAVEKTNMST
jgi:ABC-2 type transport system ATP-binding protein